MIEVGQPPYWRRGGRSLVIISMLLFGAIAFTAAVSAGEVPSDEPEVCTTTVYEGCPSRWEAEWATPTG